MDGEEVTGGSESLASIGRNGRMTHNRSNFADALQGSEQNLTKIGLKLTQKKVDDAHAIEKVYEFHEFLAHQHIGQSSVGLGKGVCDC